MTYKANLDYGRTKQNGSSRPATASARTRNRVMRGSATPAVLARQKAGLSLEKASKLAGISPKYLRRLELHGGVPYVTAMNLAKIYRCNCQVFLYR